MKHYRVALTPLSPVHIGCDDEFNPCQFIVNFDKQCIELFNPILLNLSESQGNELSKCSSVISLQRFYNRNKELCREQLLTSIAFDKGLKSILTNITLTDKISDALSRTVYSNIEAKQTAYIPGSSLKGALRTALLDRFCYKTNEINFDEKHLDKELLGGEFANSPMSLVSVSDLMPKDNVSPKTRLQMIRRFWKVDRALNVSLENSKIAEIIEMGQYQLFHGSINLKPLLKPDKRFENKNYGDNHRKQQKSRNIDISKIYKSLAEVFQDLNQFSISEFEHELYCWKECGSSTDRWINAMTKILESNRELFKSGAVALVRIGANTGFLNFTLRKDKVAYLRTKKELKYDADTACTIEQLFETTSEKGYFPLGWCLLENTDDIHPELKDVCDEIAKIYSL